MELYEALDDLVISTRYSSEGAFDIQSSNENYVQFVLENVPFTENDVFVDVGCGVGRVLSIIHRHCDMKIIGVEIDPIIAEIARDRVKDMNNVNVVTGNILDCEQVIRDATIFYLYNPFNLQIIESFLAIVKEIGRDDVRIIYLNDIFKYVFEQYKFKQIFMKQIPRQNNQDMGLSIWKKHFQ